MHSQEDYAERLREAAAAHEGVAARLQDSTAFPGRWEPLRRAHLRRAEDFLARAEHPQPEQEHDAAALASARPEELIARAVSAAQQLPSPEAGVSRPPLDLRIGIVCDRFLFDTFSGLAQLTPITPANWEEHLGKVDLLLVAATWRGHDGRAWDVTAPEAPRNRRMLTEQIIPAFQDRGIPTLFYGKEDPPDYLEFLDVARACEHIATTAEEMLPRYAEDCPQAQSIAVLPFAVNPMLHTPIGSRRPRGAGQDGVPSPVPPQDLIFFAGSWMGRKYPLRAQYARWILDGILRAGRPLAFIDRYWGAKNPVTGLPTPNQLVPFDYWPYRTPSMGHEELMELQRIVDVAVNFNSVADSLTMFANRVLELQASGTMVLSTYSRGVNTRYPQVHVARSAEDVAERLEHLPLRELRGIQSAGIRQVFLHHHGADLLAGTARRAGIEVELPAERVVAVAEEVTAELAAAMTAQQLPDGAQVALATWATLRQHDADILLPVSPGHSYPPHYAADHVAAFRYQSATATAKVAGAPDDVDGLVHRHAQGSGRVEGFDFALTAWWRPAFGTDGRTTRETLQERAEQQRFYVLPHPELWTPPAKESSAEETQPFRDRQQTRAKKAAPWMKNALRTFKRSAAGRAAGAVYRRTLKPAETGLQEELETVAADITVIDRLYEQHRIVEAESAAETARRQLSARRYSS